MKLLFVTLATLIIGVSAALLANKDPGYILIDVGGSTLETTLVLALIFLGLVFIATYYVVRMLVGTFKARTDLRRWHQQRRIRKANESLTHGLIMLAEGNWAQAEKRVLKYAEHEPMAMLNYLAAARAAQEQGSDERRDKYLNLAHKNMPSADIAVGLTQAELQLNQKQMEQALATLRRLQQLAPQHKKVLRALAAVYGKLGDWDHLIELVPDMRKRDVLSMEEIDQLEQMAFIELLNRIDNADHEGLQNVWYRIPQSLQAREPVLTNYINRLIQQGKSDIAEPLIRNGLKRQWSDSLIHLYGVIDAVDVKAQLFTAEAWLKTHENNPMLLLTLGRICLKSGLWGKARTYLEASVGAANLPEAYNELGHLLEKMGEPEKAMTYYRKGLSNTPGCDISISKDSKLVELEKNPPATALIANPKVIAS